MSVVQLLEKENKNLKEKKKKTLIKSKVSDTYTLLTLGKAMCSFTWKNKNVSLIREDSLILTKRKELNKISYVL